MRFRLALAVALLAIGAGAGGAEAEAAVVAGSNLSQEGSPFTCFPNPFEPAAPPFSCTLAIAAVPADRREGSDHAAIDGVIVGWKVRTGTNMEEESIRLRVIRDETGAGTGPVEVLPTAAGTYSYSARLPVRGGDEIGVDLLDVAKFPGAAIFATADSAAFDIWTPPLADGETRSPSSTTGFYVLMNATIEPDADGDGFGDETQDGCPTTAASAGSCPPEPAPALASVMPDTSLKGPQGTIHKRSATFRFSATVAGSTFQCRLDKKPFKGCKSPKAYKGLAEGKHVFKVRAVGPTGLMDPKAAKRTFKVEL